VGRDARANYTRKLGQALEIAETSCELVRKLGDLTIALGVQAQAGRPLTPEQIGEIAILPALLTINAHSQQQLATLRSDLR
jgi:hypothetical protein